MVKIEWLLLFGRYTNIREAYSDEHRCKTVSMPILFIDGCNVAMLLVKFCFVLIILLLKNHALLVFKISTKAHTHEKSFAVIKYSKISKLFIFILFS